MRRIASRPSRGRLPWAARPARLDLDPREPLVADAICRSVGSVTTARVGAPARHERVRADAGVLLVDDRRDDQAARRQAASRATRRAASIIAATPPFMSCEPRP